MHLDLAVWLNLISTIAIVAALIFTALQVRQGNIKRRDQAAITLINTIQDQSWARGIDLITNLPANATRSDFEHASPEVQSAVTELGIRLETIGYLVFRRSIDLQTVDDLAGGIVLDFWSRAKCWAERERERTGNSKYAEWVEWLSDRIAARHAQMGRKTAYRDYQDWQE
jgi:hypothetical protein